MKDFVKEDDIYVIQTRKKPTLGEKLGLQAAQMADSLIPAVMNKLVDSLSKANSSLLQIRDPKL